MIWSLLMTSSIGIFKEMIISNHNYSDNSKHICKGQIDDYVVQCTINVHYASLIGCTLPRPSIFGPYELVPIFGPHELVPIFGPHELVPIFGPYESITIFGPYESITIFGPYFRNIFSIIFFNSLIHNLSIECDSCGKIFLMLVIWEDTSKLFMKVTKISNVNLV